MAEKKYIELEALMNVPIRRDHYDKKNGDVNFINGIEFVLEYAEYLPAADVISVVRCKDCKYFKSRNSLGTQGICFCGEKNMNYNGEFYPYLDDYCSYGERKDNNG